MFFYNYLQENKISKMSKTDFFFHLLTVFNNIHSTLIPRISIFSVILVEKLLSLSMQLIASTYYFFIYFHSCKFYVARNFIVQRTLKETNFRFLLNLDCNYSFPRNSVCCQINRKTLISIQTCLALIRFRNGFICVSIKD